MLHRLPGPVVLDDALAQARAIDRGTEDGAIAGFNASYQTIKDGIRRAAEIEKELTPAALTIIESARQALVPVAGAGRGAGPRACGPGGSR